MFGLVCCLATSRQQDGFPEEQIPHWLTLHQTKIFCTLQNPHKLNTECPLDTQHSVLYVYET